jgi:cell wall-associated NlpC family hydrolase
MSLRLTKPILAFAVALVLFCCLPKVEAEAKVHGPSSVVAAKVKKKQPKPPRKKRKRLTHKQKVERKTKRVVRIAKRYLGVSYRWGGSSPRSGFDCSGLVKYVYGRVGIRLPHVAAGQFHRGRRVKASNLHRGDLVFFNRLGHVGVYIGRGKMIHAPNSRSTVRIESLRGYWGGVFVGARRLVY